MIKGCLCDTNQIIINISKIFGVLPITKTHKDNTCVFTISKVWVIYSIICILTGIGYLTQVFQAISSPFSTDRSQVLSSVASIDDYISMVFIIIFTILNIIRAKNICNFFNESILLRNNDLFCKKNIKIHNMWSKLFIVFFVALFIVQYIAIFILNFMDRFETDWSYQRLLKPFLENVPVLCLAIIGSCCNILLSNLTCFGKIMMLYLKFTPIHPMPDFDETQEAQSILGVYKYQKCVHKIMVDHMDNVKAVDYLKWLHGKIRHNINIANKAFSPLLLIFMAYEIVELVLHWYSIIIFFTNPAPTSAEYTLNFFNWLFIVNHTTILFIFLGKANQIEEAVSISFHHHHHHHHHRMPYPK